MERPSPRPLRPSIFLSILHRASILLLAFPLRFNILSADDDKCRYRNRLRRSTTKDCRDGRHVGVDDDEVVRPPHE